MKAIAMPTVADEQLVDMLRAVANPVRYRILQILEETKECHCGRLGASFPIAPSTLSQHLKVLRDAGLIWASSDGPSVIYHRDEDKIAWLKTRVSGL